MASGGDFQGLVLKGVTQLERDELGRGAYGRVYAVNYYGTICAAKEVTTPFWSKELDKYKCSEPSSRL